MQDYNYLHGNCLEITMELSCCKYPPASELQNEWDMNRESLMAYMEKVGRRQSNHDTYLVCMYYVHGYTYVPVIKHDQLFLGL